ncbi:hypothetical protein EPH_0007560 [Eimeria praecox]|uniref:Uncharacterized protein n=1 Tax=Eimeria praecox TaxID=51316 RepID=U6GCG2_9EIME|nr:hypothetical protein EPH_0007560 [Eimeria praecox]
MDPSSNPNALGWPLRPLLPALSEGFDVYEKQLKILSFRDWLIDLRVESAAAAELVGAYSPAPTAAAAAAATTAAAAAAAAEATTATEAADKDPTPSAAPTAAPAAAPPTATAATPAAAPAAPTATAAASPAAAATAAAAAAAASGMKRASMVVEGFTLVYARGASVFEGSCNWGGDVGLRDCEVVGFVGC